MVAMPTIIKTLLLSCLISGVVFYLFLKSRLSDKEGENTVNINSWHGRLAYPLRRHSDWQFESTFIRYFSKIFFMIIAGWPVLIIWQALKMIIYTPFCLMFGHYPKPGIKAMTEDDNPFAMEFNQFYLPTIGKDEPIFPFYFVVTILYGWLCYRRPLIVLGVTLLILLIIGAFVLLVYLEDKKYLDPAKTWLIPKLEQLGKKYQHFKKHNLTITFKKFKSH